jgi:hypothetical protein
MISSIEWVPAGIADPNPKKYELSTTEQQLIDMMDENGNFVSTYPIESNITDGNDQPNADSERNLRSRRNTNATNPTTKIRLPKIENQLPADLRMDEYDDDDEDNDEKGGVRIGRLLVAGDGDEEGMDNDDIDEEDEIDADHEIGETDFHDDDQRQIYNDDDDDDEEEDEENDDDFADVPDTREYEPIDVEGLEAMRLGQNAGTMNDEFDDDNESEADDVALKPDDALIIVAKTEDVSLFQSAKYD